MTHRQSAAGGRDVAARWCALAEQRLEHLSEMFETGRWRRYHSEIAFLENIQEAKRAVQTWRAIATGGDVAAAAASVTPAFGWSPATLSRLAPREQAQTTQPKITQPKSVEATTFETKAVQPKPVQPKPVQPKAVHIVPETAVPVRLESTLNVLAEVIEAPLVPTAPRAAMASFTAPVAVPPLKAPAAKAPFIAPAVRPPLAASAPPAPFTAPVVRPPVAAPAVKAAVAAPVVKAPAAMAALLPQFAPPAAEIVAAPERVVEFTFSLDGLEAKYPLLRNAF